MHQSPRFFGRDHGMTADEVYNKWEKFGLIERIYNEKYPGKGYFSWGITEKGKSLGGRKSSNGTPTFDYEDIKNIFRRK